MKPKWIASLQWKEISMDEYSRIIIEQYYLKHPKTKKAEFLGYMLEKSYDLGYDPEDSEMIKLSQLIDRERNMELREALEDLDDFLCC